LWRSTLWYPLPKQVTWLALAIRKSHLNNDLHSYAPCREVFLCWLACQLGAVFPQLAAFKHNPEHRFVVSVLVRLLQSLKALPSTNRSDIHIG